MLIHYQMVNAAGIGRTVRSFGRSRGKIAEKPMIIIIANSTGSDQRIVSIARTPTATLYRLAFYKPDAKGQIV